MRSLFPAVTLIFAACSAEPRHAEPRHAELAARLHVLPDELAAVMAHAGLTAEEVASLPADFVQRSLRQLRRPRPDQPDGAEEFRLQ
jgi:hypothetical protein